MIGYSWNAYKVFWYFYSMFCTLLYFTYMGMMIVSFTPTYPVAAILQSSFYTMFNLFSGFIIPQPVSFISVFVSLLIMAINYVKWEWNPPIFLHAENSQVVVMVLLPHTYFLDSKWHAYLPVWRCREGDYCVWRKEDSCSVCKGLLWISPWSLANGWCDFDVIPNYICFNFCILYREVEFPKEVNVVKYLCYLSKFRHKSCPLMDLHMGFM